MRAPENFSTPSITAVLPSTLETAPMRANSSKYLKRFSKILSAIVLVPSHNASVTPICGCISVGNPGYGSVFTCVLWSLFFATTRTASSNSSTSQPISSSFAIVASKCFGITLSTVTSPIVAAAANINVPASIWSGIIEYSVLWSLETPLIFITSVPAPLIFAPILLRKLATSTTCGSFATFSIIVSPSAMAAASITLIVAPTLTTSKKICVPFKHSVSAIIFPCSMQTSAPNARNPLRCWSIGLLPILQPPGKATSARWCLPSSAPNK